MANTTPVGDLSYLSVGSGLYMVCSGPTVPRTCTLSTSGPPVCDPGADPSLVPLLYHIGMVLMALIYAATDCFLFVLRRPQTWGPPMCGALSVNSVGEAVGIIGGFVATALLPWTGSTFCCTSACCSVASCLRKMVVTIQGLAALVLSGPMTAMLGPASPGHHGAVAVALVSTGALWAYTGVHALQSPRDPYRSFQLFVYAHALVLVRALVSVLRAAKVQAMESKVLYDVILFYSIGVTFLLTWAEWGILLFLITAVAAVCVEVVLWKGSEEARRLSMEEFPPRSALLSQSPQDGAANSGLWSRVAGESKTIARWLSHQLYEFSNTRFNLHQDVQESVKKAIADANINDPQRMMHHSMSTVASNPLYGAHAHFFANTVLSAFQKKPDGEPAAGPAWYMASYWAKRGDTQGSSGKLSSGAAEAEGSAPVPAAKPLLPTKSKPRGFAWLPSWTESLYSTATVQSKSAIHVDVAPVSADVATHEKREAGVAAAPPDPPKSVGLASLLSEKMIDRGIDSSSTSADATSSPDVQPSTDDTPTVPANLPSTADVATGALDIPTATAIPLNSGAEITENLVPTSSISSGDGSGQWVAETFGATTASAPKITASQTKTTESTTQDIAPTAGHLSTADSGTWTISPVDDDATMSHRHVPRIVDVQQEQASSEDATPASMAADGVSGTGGALSGSQTADATSASTSKFPDEEGEGEGSQEGIDLMGDLAKQLEDMNRANERDQDRRDARS